RSSIIFTATIAIRTSSAAAAVRTVEPAATAGGWSGLQRSKWPSTERSQPMAWPGAASPVAAAAAESKLSRGRSAAAAPFTPTAAAAPKNQAVAAVDASRSPGLRPVNRALPRHRGATASGQSLLSVSANTLRIDATRRIDVSGRGYLGGHGGDNNLIQARTLNNAIGSERRSGGSYGGLG